MKGRCFYGAAVIFMAKGRHVLVVAGIAVLLVLVLLPGILSVNLMMHEAYHIFMHKGFADSVCLDINRPYIAHVNVVFSNGTEIKAYRGSLEDDEERMANIVGKAFSFVYVLFSLLAIFLVGWVVADGVKCRFIGQMRYMHGRLKAKFKRKGSRKRK